MTEYQQKGWNVSFLLSYVLFGAVHEASHLLSAKGLGYDVSAGEFLGALLGRACRIPSMEESDDWEISAVRNAGWITSLMIAAVLFGIFGRKNNHPLLAGACVTAVEAIVTDLMGMHCGGKTTFYCGNFGVILLNSAWTSTPGDYGKTALTLLEKMIEITMMRGAQTGGVVTWTRSKKGGEPTPIRCRVVNGKRTDLSEQIRKLLNRKVCSGGRINPSIQCLLGHTRFATSSKATMDGTHPHQWCPPENRRVFPLDDQKLWTSSSPAPVVQKVGISEKMNSSCQICFYLSKFLSL